MAFCTHCGYPLNEGAKFCTNCGQSNLLYKSAISGRKIIYAGEIHKCPNCGEIIDSFVTSCPSCGYEIRVSKATISLQQFYWGVHNSQTTEEKALMIRNYPIPNAKEDIIEFMILASSNINGEADKIIFEAWGAKIEQAYQKSQLTLQNDPAFSQIKELYEKAEKTISKGRIAHTTNSAGDFIGQFFDEMPNTVFAILAIMLLIFNVIRIADGAFGGIDIIFDAIILSVTYGIKKKKD